VRQGVNPGLEDNGLGGLRRHRVIVPVYIPKLSGYFEHALEVLTLCLESLRLTSEGKASVTLVANGCAPEVVAGLQRQHDCGWVDQLLLNRDNRGKVDAVASVARGAFEELITISDCDVLFKQGWLEAIDEIFETFPECGFASPAPNPGLAWYHTSSTILAALVRGEVRLEKVVPDADLDSFANSIGWPGVFGPSQRRSQIVLRRNGASACVGAGHFICTIRKEVVPAVPPDPCGRHVHGAEDRWLDQPPDALGFWRLSTTRAYAYHMGNVPEPWMYRELKECRRSTPSAIKTPRAVPAAKRTWPTILPARPRRWMTRLIRAAFTTFARFETTRRKSLAEESRAAD
jgi:hypothetical protein